MFDIFRSKNKLESFFNPQSVAIVGASEKKGKIGNIISRNLLELGYNGEVFFINPKHTEILGQKSYSALENIEKDIDLAVIAVPAKFVNEVIQNSARKIKNFVVISAGFSETGKDGKKQEDALFEIAKKNNLNILGPNCLGFINPNINLNASFASDMPNAGNIAFISQSGALAVALMDIAQKRKLNFSQIISVGNKMQMDEAEIIKYLKEDNSTKIIGIYIEGIKNGSKFLEAAKEISRKKPIIVLKAGKTEKAQKAISSHTGALAGSDVVMDVAFEKAGIIRADNLENFFDVIDFFSNLKFSKTENKVAVITNAGGPGVLITDAFKDKKIQLTEFSKKVKEDLKKILPGEASVENPIDVLGDAGVERYKKALEVVEKADADFVVCILTAQDQTPVDEIAREIVDFRKRTRKVVVGVFIGGDKVEKGLNILRLGEVTNFSFPNQAVHALNKYYNWNSFQTSKEILNLNKSKKRANEISSIVSRAKKEKRKALLFAESQKIMKMYGVDVVQTIALSSGEEVSTEIKFPVVVKVDSDKVLHKTDKQGIILGVKNKKELNNAIGKIRTSFPDENLIIQTMEETQTEIILGIKRDPTFGPLVVVGLGGIYTEIFKIADFFIPPMSKEEIKNKLKNSKLKFLFEGARGQNPYNLDELTSIIEKVMFFAQEAKDIQEVDINPMFIYNDNRKALAADIKIIF